MSITARRNLTAPTPGDPTRIGLDPNQAQQALFDEYNELQSAGGDDEEYVEPSKADKKKFQEREVEVAVADLACKKKLSYDDKLEKLHNLVVYRLTADDAQALGALASRSMALQCTIQEGEALITGEGDPVRVEPVVLFGS